MGLQGTVNLQVLFHSEGNGVEGDGVVVVVVGRGGGGFQRPLQFISTGIERRISLVVAKESWFNVSTFWRAISIAVMK